VRVRTNQCESIPVRSGKQHFSTKFSNLHDNCLALPLSQLAHSPPLSEEMKQRTCAALLREDTRLSVSIRQWIAQRMELQKLCVPRLRLAGNVSKDHLVMATIANIPDEIVSQRKQRATYIFVIASMDAWHAALA
jgi:hypothetical protein